MRKFFLFFLILLIPLATAHPCDLTQDLQCQEIQNLNLTDLEKEQLYQSITATDYPNHDLIQSYNSAIQFSTPPENTQIHSTSYIRNAWLEIATIMPSIILNDSLYSKETGNILTAYNFQIQLPNNTDTEKYSLQSQEAQLNIYQNNQLIGSSTLQSYTISEDTEFRADLNIEVTVRTDYYAQDEYSHTTYSTEQISISDNLKVKYYKKQPEGNILILDQIYDSYKGSINANNYTNLTLTFNNSEYKQNNFYYIPEFTLKPYYVVTLKAIPQGYSESNNIIVDENEFNVSDITNSTLILYNHFDSFEFPQEFEFEDDDLEFKIDKLIYKQGDTITITSDKEAMFEYNYQTQFGTTVTFTASPESTTIKAYYNEKEYTKMVFTSANSWRQAYNIGFFAVLIFFISKVGVFFLKGAIS
ncbi:MAG: hypothetical protein ABIJ18_04930 [archaeon]